MDFILGDDDHYYQSIYENIQQVQLVGPETALGTSKEGNNCRSINYKVAAIIEITFYYRQRTLYKIYLNMIEPLYIQYLKNPWRISVPFFKAKKKR